MRIAAVAAGLLLVAACKGGDDDKQATTTPVVAGTTWHQDAAPIFSENCIQCHTSAGVAAFLDLTQYDQAVAWAPVIASNASEGTMPPFGAVETTECENRWGFLHDARLTPEEVVLVQAWVDDGTLEGDPATAAPLLQPDIPQLARVDHEIAPQTAHTTQGSQALKDEFYCFVFDPEVSETRWVEGLQVQPDNISVVHHVLLNVASRADAEAADAADGVVDGIYPCFGGVGVAGARLIGGWIPGGGPTEYPEGSGAELRADEVLVAQMHYHNTVDPQTDSTSVQIMWTETEPPFPALIELLGNAADASQGLQPGPSDPNGAAEFLIPAGDASHVETSRHELPIPEGVEVDVFLVAPHMHYAGVSMRAWVEHADGSPNDCLVHVPAWDFDWQLLYFFDATNRNAPVVKSGDTLVLECIYNNTLDNGGLASVLAEAGIDEPTDIGLGGGSLEEMCLLGVGAMVR